jgi:beta-carotene 15,15'-dioxygenase
MKNNIQISVSTITQNLLETPTLISVLIGSFLVMWQFSTGNLPPSVQFTFFASFIFLTGIPHGAIDHLVERETAERQQKVFNLPFFLLKYVLTMLFYALMWYVLPSVSLLFFLLISAWHFGETDIENAPSTPFWNVTRFAFGCFVLLWILLFHAEETTPILERISQNSGSVLPVWSWAVVFKMPLLVSFGLFSLAFFYFSDKNNPIAFDKIRFLRLSIILGLTYFLPLLPAFALYFGGWHALCSFKNIHDYLLENDDTLRSKKPISSVLNIWTKTLFFTFLAFAFLVFAVWYWLHFLQTWDPLPLLFIFLSLITLPHLHVMHRMYKAK